MDKINITLSKDKKLNRILQLDEFCKVCTYEHICPEKDPPCSYMPIECVINMNKVDAVHKQIFGF